MADIRTYPQASSTFDGSEGIVGVQHGQTVLFSGPTFLAALGSGSGNTANWTPGSDVVVTDYVTLGTNIAINSLTINEGATVRFSPTQSVSLNVSHNIIVKGILEIQPNSLSVIHDVLVSGANEALYVGGGCDPTVTPLDYGIWVIGNGELRIQGTRKTAWGTVSGSLSAGATTMTVNGDNPVVDIADPTDVSLYGWAQGDTIVVAATGAPTAGHPDPYDLYDVVTITSVSGNSVGFTPALAFDHPSAPIKYIATDDTGETKTESTVTRTAEVFNLTRNVKLHGLDNTHRTHLLMNSSRPQTVSFSESYFMGPRQGSSPSVFVKGRYSYHFHVGHDGMRGSTVEGSVAHDCGSHCFVPHSSNGITFRRCISWNTMEEPYWYDTHPPITPPNPPFDMTKDITRDLVFDKCVAGYAFCDPVDPARFTLAGFQLQMGYGLTCTNNIATSIHGATDSSGFTWPETFSGFWVFQGNVAHNCTRNGIFVWQNVQEPHLITDFDAYHNGRAGIRAGAYGNSYQYRRCHLMGNYEAQLDIQAISTDSVSQIAFAGIQQPLTFDSCTFDTGGVVGAVCVEIQTPILTPSNATQIRNCKFYGTTVTADIIFNQGDQNTGVHNVELIQNSWSTPVQNGTSGFPAFSANPTYMLPGSIIKLYDTSSDGVHHVAYVCTAQSDTSTYPSDTNFNFWNVKRHTANSTETAGWTLNPNGNGGVHIFPPEGFVRSIGQEITDTTPC